MTNNSDINSFLSENKIEFSSIDKLTLAGNNLLYKLTTRNKTFALKQYFVDQHNRFEREIAFLKLLSYGNIHNVPSILIMDQKRKISLTDWIDGERIEKPTQNDVAIASQFICDINKIDNPTYQNMVPAVDAGFSYLDHYNNLTQRISNLKKNAAESNLADEFKKMILDIEIASKKLPSNNLYICEKSIVSPSDFGFHNIIRNQNTFYFLDFEYAGLDDPTKLCCDFFLQPKIKTDINYIDTYINTTASILDLKIEEFRNRIQILFPLCVIKWACITMNIVNPKLLKKRINATGLAKEIILSNQLNQAKKFLEIFNCLR